jgi:uncharacterized membrane protein YedE/YeeE
MTVALAFLPLSLLLAAIIGFTMERAGVCTVKAAEEVLTTGRALMFVSFGKAVLWIMALTIPLLWLVPEARTLPVGWALSVYSFVGGVIFGIGAAVNGGCAFSTLSALASGRTAMLVTLGAFCAGAAAQTVMVADGWLPAPAPGKAYLAESAHWVTAVFAMMMVWAIWEVVRLWRTRAAGATLCEFALADRYRLSTAALLIGLSNAVLFTLNGTWLYTKVLVDGGRSLGGGDTTINAVRWALVAALAIGAILSAVQGRRFKLDWRPTPAWVGNLVGGFLMGLGAAMIPGGNGVLILGALPSLAVHAVPAYLGIVGGIFLALAAYRAIGGSVDAVDCNGDVCRS